MDKPNDTLQRYVLAVASHLALLLAWYLFVKFGDVPKYVMPSPEATFAALTDGSYNWWGNALVTGTEIRLPLKRFLEPSFPRLVVLSYQELPNTTEIENTGIITPPPQAAAPRGDMATVRAA